ncbi:MAG: flippase-like domain-containing protein [Chloroflexi bacterium]|nr:flippase-like domain-containing protein [Chloroflexota bacterium]
MRRYRNQVLAGLVFLALALIAVVVITGVDDLVENLADFPLWLFVPITALKLLNWALRYLEWRYFLGVIGVRTVWRNPALSTSLPQDAETPLITIRERDSVIVWLSALPLSISPGKLAEVLKALVLKNITGTNITRSAPVIFMERLVDGLAVIVLAAVSMLFIADTLNTGDISVGYVRGVLLGTTLFLAAGIAVVQYRPLSLWLLDRAQGWPLLRRVESGLRTLYEASYDLLKLRHLLPTTLIGIAAYLTDCLGFYLLLTGLDITGTWTLLGQATFILGFAVVVAALSAMPGGAGGRELTVGAMLTGVVGLSKADAGTATFLVSIFQVWLGVLLGLGIIAVFRNTLFPPALEDLIAEYESAAQSHP